MQFQETVGHHTDKPIKYLKTQFTAYQRYGLETAFSQSPYIPPSKRLSLSQELGTSEETIQVYLHVDPQYFHCYATFGFKLNLDYR